MKRILVVDDDSGVRTLVETILRRAGYEVVAAENGLAAVECLNALECDLIFLDLMMPIMSGFDVLQHYKDNDETLLRRIVVMTAVSDRVLEQLDGGSVCAVLRKPFDIKDVLQVVEHCFKNKA